MIKKIKYLLENENFLCCILVFKFEGMNFVQQINGRQSEELYFKRKSEEFIFTKKK